MQDTRLTPESSRCACCGTPDALPFQFSTGYEEPLCPACATRAALLQAAEASLHALLWPVIEKWAKHWVAAGCQPGQLQAALAMYGEYFHNDGAHARPDEDGDPHQQAIYDALGLPMPEGVQPAPVAEAAD